MKNHRTTKEEYNNIIELLKTHNMVEVSNITGIKWSTIKNYKNGRSKCAEEFKERPTTNQITQLKFSETEYVRSINPNISENECFAYYSFILGLYLGDGCISQLPRTQKLEIALDSKYKKMNDYVMFVFEKLFNKPPYVLDFSNFEKSRKTYKNMINVIYYNCNLGYIFPHLGPLQKHLRKIELQEWQKSIIIPKEFIRGLIYSDGSFYYDSFNQKYFYNFSNLSEDISKLFSGYLNILNIAHNTNIKRHTDIQIL